MRLSRSTALLLMKHGTAFLGLKVRMHLVQEHTNGTVDTNLTMLQRTTLRGAVDPIPLPPHKNSVRWHPYLPSPSHPLFPSMQ
jgi:hypothetical protein